MFQRILNAVAQSSGYGQHQLRPQRAPDRIATERQRQPRHLLPPSPEIHNAMQSGLVISQLPFMNEQSSLVLPLKHLRNNLIEGHDFGFNSRSKKLQRKISSRQRARNRDAFIFDFNLRKGPWRNDHR